MTAAANLGRPLSPLPLKSLPRASIDGIVSTRGTIAASGHVEMTTQDDRSGLELFEDVAVQQRTWQVERAAWVLMLAVVIAALLGLFGDGWLGSAHAVSGDGSVSLEYDRFWRVQAPSRLRIETARAGAPERDAMRLWIARDYFESVSVEQVMPRPERVEAAEDRIVFELALSAPSEPVVVLLRIEAVRPGKVNGRLGIEGGEEINFSQFIFP